MGSLCPSSLSAQTLTFTGSNPYVSFGNVNVCRPGEDGPAPCSKTITLDYKVTKGGTLGTPKVVLLGAPNLDFTLANGTTCVGGVTTGETCAVNVTFTPKFPGNRPGAVLLAAADGSVVVTTALSGVGEGPMIGAYTNGLLTTTNVNVPGFSYVAATPAVDGAGNVFLATDFYLDGGVSAVYELPVGGGPQVQLPFDFTGTIGPNDGNYQPTEPGLAIDAAGDIFVTTVSSTSPYSNLLLELAAGGGPQVTFSFEPATNNPNFNISISGIDGEGNLLVRSNDAELKLPLGCKSNACLVPVSTENDIIYSYYLDGLGDDLGLGETDYTTDNGYTLNVVEDIQETPAGKTTPITLASDIATYIFENTQGGVPNFISTPSLIGDVYVSEEGYDEAEESLVTYYRSQFAPLTFGNGIPVGTSVTVPLGVTNTGNQTLSFTPYFKSPSYKILSTSPAGCESATAPGATCTLNIQFTALTVGNHKIVLTLSGNAATDTTILLEGTGTK